MFQCGCNLITRSFFIIVLLAIVIHHSSSLSVIIHYLLLINIIYCCFIRHYLLFVFIIQFSIQPLRAFRRTCVVFWSLVLGLYDPL